MPHDSGLLKQIDEVREDVSAIGFFVKNLQHAEARALAIQQHRDFTAYLLDMRLSLQACPLRSSDPPVIKEALAVIKELLVAVLAANGA